MKIWALRLVLCAAFAIGLSLSASAQNSSGQIKIGKVDGVEVFRVTADGQSATVKPGDFVRPSDVITTGKNSSVVLVFMNGSSVRVGSDSKLAIEQFLMDPLDEDIVVARLKDEPSVSQTTLNLAYGEVVGDVKKLNRASSFSIKTPIGAAGIRGTTFRIVFRPSGDGRTYYFQLATASGLVVFEGTVDAGLAPVPVGELQEFVVVADLDPTTGEIVIRSSRSAGPISADALQAIMASLADAIQQAEQLITFPANQNGDDPTPGQPSTAGATNPPDNTTRLPQLTPGAGG